MHCYFGMRCNAHLTSMLPLPMLDDNGRATGVIISEVPRKDLTTIGIAVCLAFCYGACPEHDAMTSRWQLAHRNRAVSSFAMRQPLLVSRSL